MATLMGSENFLRSGEVSFKGFSAGLAESKDKYNRHKSMILYNSTFVISAYRTREKLLVKREFERSKARRFYRSIRFFRNHITWLK